MADRAYRHALLVMAMPMIRRQGTTLVGVAVANLDDSGAVQLTLPLDRHSGAALDVALHEVRDRFGSDAVTRAVLLGRDQGLSVPILPTEARRRPPTIRQVLHRGGFIRVASH